MMFFIERFSDLNSLIIAVLITTLGSITEQC